MITLEWTYVRIIIVHLTITFKLMELHYLERVNLPRDIIHWSD